MKQNLQLNTEQNLKEMEDAQISVVLFEVKDIITSSACASTSNCGASL